MANKKVLIENCVFAVNDYKSFTLITLGTDVKEELERYWTTPQKLDALFGGELDFVEPIENMEPGIYLIDLVVEFFSSEYPMEPVDYDSRYYYHNIRKVEIDKIINNKNMKFQDFKDAYARKLKLGYNDFDDLLSDGKRQNVFAIEAHLDKAAQLWVKAELNNQQWETITMIQDKLHELTEDTPDNEAESLEAESLDKVKIRRHNCYRNTKLDRSAAIYGHDLALREIELKIIQLKPKALITSPQRYSFTNEPR